MALGPNRQVIWTEVRYALNEVAERGCVASNATTAGEVTCLADPTGTSTTPVGVLLDDVESLNFDRHGEYRQRNVVDVGSVVGLLVKGDLETNLVLGTPSEGDPAYLAASGWVSTTQLQDGLGNNAPQVGKFRTTVNANGFATVAFDL